MTSSLPTPETTFEMKWVPANLFVGGSCDGLMLHETRDLAEFLVTIPGKDGNPATVETERYHRVCFERGSCGNIVMYLISTMGNDDILGLRNEVYKATQGEE